MFKNKIRVQLYRAGRKGCSGWYCREESTAGRTIGRRVQRAVLQGGEYSGPYYRTEGTGGGTVGRRVQRAVCREEGTAAGTVL